MNMQPSSVAVFCALQDAVYHPLQPQPRALDAGGGGVRTDR